MKWDIDSWFLSHWVYNNKKVRKWHVVAAYSLLFKEKWYCDIIWNRFTHFLLWYYFSHKDIQGTLLRKRGNYRYTFVGIWVFLVEKGTFQNRCGKRMTSYCYNRSEKKIRGYLFIFGCWLISFQDMIMPRFIRPLSCYTVSKLWVEQE